MISFQTLDSYTNKETCKIFSLQSVDVKSSGKEAHRHDFFQVLMLKKGRIQHTIDFETKESEAPYISVIFPNQVHRMDLSEDAEADIIMFDKAVFCSSILSNELKEYNVDLQSRLNHVVDVPKDEWNEIYVQIDAIRSLYSDINVIRKWQIKFMIKIIILKIIDIAPLARPIYNIDTDVMIYQKFRELLDKEFASQKKVLHYAELLNVSTKKLTSVCYKYTGHSPLEIIHEKLSLELKKALVEDGLMLKEIAFQFGFSSQSALNKFIERHFGCSPQSLRTDLEKNIMGKI